MATVTGLTAERTLQIEAAMIVALTIDASNHIILTKHDGGTIDCGPIPSSSATAQGIVELATTVEATTGTDTVRAVTPAGLSAAITAAAVPDATTSVKGKVQLATGAEATTGTDTAKVVTPAALATAVPAATTSAVGKVQLATTAETQAGSLSTKAVTPAGLLGTVGTTSQKGVLQLATNTEATTGTDTAKAVTPAGVAAAITAGATPSASTTAQGKIEIATVGESYAGTDAVRAVTPANIAAMQGTGIYVPAGWGANWRAKRDVANTGSNKAIIAAVGSSSTQGLYCGNLLTDSFVSKLRTQLQTSYGAGGSGFFGSTRSLTYLSASTLTNSWNSTAGNLATMSGTWSGGNYYGPGGFYMYTGDAGGYIQFTKVNGTTVRIYTMSGGGRANWQYQIDGGTITNVTDSGTPSIQVTTITGLSSGDHTVKLIQNSAAGTNFAVCGVTGENANGVIVNNFGLSGATSANFAASTNEIYQPQTWNGGPDYTADLLIYALGANDANAGTAIDTYIQNVHKFLKNVKDGQSASAVKATGTTDILILLQHIGNYDNATPKWPDYCDRLRGVAEAYGAAIVNLWPVGKNSWNNWNNAGNWGTSGSTGGVAGTDAIHMSNAGHTAAYNAILPLLTA